jgi:hypothetical protein
MENLERNITKGTIEITPNLQLYLSKKKKKHQIYNCDNTKASIYLYNIPLLLGSSSPITDKAMRLIFPPLSHTRPIFPLTQPPNMCLPRCT